MTSASIGLQRFGISGTNRISTLIGSPRKNLRAPSVRRPTRVVVPVGRGPPLPVHRSPFPLPLLPVTPPVIPPILPPPRRRSLLRRILPVIIPLHRMPLVMTGLGVTLVVSLDDRVHVRAPAQGGLDLGTGRVSAGGPGRDLTTGPVDATGPDPGLGTGGVVSRHSSSSGEDRSYSPHRYRSHRSPGEYSNYRQSRRRHRSPVQHRHYRSPVRSPVHSGHHFAPVITGHMDQPGTFRMPPAPGFPVHGPTGPVHGFTGQMPISTGQIGLNLNPTGQTGVDPVFTGQNPNPTGQTGVGTPMGPPALPQTDQSPFGPRAQDLASVVEQLNSIRSFFSSPQFTGQGGLLHPSAGVSRAPVSSPSNPESELVQGDSSGSVLRSTSEERDGSRGLSPAAKRSRTSQEQADDIISLHPSASDNLFQECQRERGSETSRMDESRTGSRTHRSSSKSDVTHDQEEEDAPVHSSARHQLLAAVQEVFHIMPKDICTPASQADRIVIPSAMDLSGAEVPTSATNSDLPEPPARARLAEVLEKQGTFNANGWSVPSSVKRTLVPSSIYKLGGDLKFQSTPPELEEDANRLQLSTPKSAPTSFKTLEGWEKTSREVLSMTSVAEWLSASLERQVASELPADRSPQLQTLFSALNGCVKHIQASLMLQSSDILMTRREAVLAQTPALSSHAKDTLKFAPITHKKLFGSRIGDVVKLEHQDKQLKVLSRQSSSRPSNLNYKIPKTKSAKPKSKPAQPSGQSQTNSSQASPQPPRSSQPPARGGSQASPRRGGYSRGGASRGRLP